MEKLIKKLPAAPSDSSDVEVVVSVDKGTFFCSVAAVVINVTRSRRSSNSFQKIGHEVEVCKDQGFDVEVRNNQDEPCDERASSDWHNASSLR